MVKSWRPLNWLNPFAEELLEIEARGRELGIADPWTGETSVGFDAYEAGADAILTCLIKDGILDINKLKEHMPSMNYERFLEQLRNESYEQGKKDEHKADIDWIKEHNDFTRLKICCERHGVLLTEKEWQEFISG